MTCTEADNVFPLAIQGSFDDAQTAMKAVFQNRAFAEEVGLSAVNSINLARILAQCVLLPVCIFSFAGRYSRSSDICRANRQLRKCAGWLAGTAHGRSYQGIPCSHQQK